MRLEAISTICFSYGVFLIALLTVLFKRRDVVGFLFLNFSFFVSIWGIFFALLVQGVNYDATLLISKIGNMAALFISVTWTQFIFYFIHKREPFKRFFLSLYLMDVVIASLAIPTDLFIPGLHETRYYLHYTSAGPLFHVFTVQFFTLVSFGFYCLVKEYTRASDRYKMQLLYFVLATFIGFISGGTTFLPVYGIDMPLVLLPLMLTYPLFMGIAILRYGLFDSEQVLDAFQKEKMVVMGVLAASLNHEIKNAIYIAKGRIEGQLERIKENTFKSAEHENEQHRTVLQKVYDQLIRASDIIQRFTDFVKPHPKLQKKEKVSLEKAVKEVISLISYETTSKNISIELNLGNEEIFIQPRDFEEILLNLIVNAYHAMANQERGKVFIKSSRSDGMIVLEIQDTGPGIPPEHLDRIFEPFFTTKGEKGTGLGLSIVKQLVEKNTGKISVNSKVGIGTTFMLEFKK